MNAHFFLRLRSPVLIGLMLPAALLAADNVTVTTQTYTNTQTVQADNKVTTSGSVVVANGGNVTFEAGGRTSLAAGFKVNAGGLFRVSIGQALPFSAGFESAEGYTAASIDNQKGWNLLQGTADVSSSAAYTGSNGLALVSGATAAATQHAFLLSASPGIAFVDVYAKPVAAASAVASSVIQTESAQVGFQLASGQGEVYVFDGVGANQWVATGLRFAINGSNQATGWLRLTLRGDYSAKKWDLYVNGQLADYDLAFASNSETFLRVLTLLGITSATAYFDNVAAQAGNPLFTDTDKDGMPDTWETTHGLNNALDDRNSDKDSDGKTNIEEYFLGTSASNPDVTAPTVPGAVAFVSSVPTAIGLSWTVATDSGAGTSGVAGYNVYRNGVKVNTSLITATNFTDTGLTASTAYSYVVKTVDIAGNQSGASPAIALTTPSSSTSGEFLIFTPLP